VPRDVLTVGTLTDAPPSIYVENGNLTGYDKPNIAAEMQAGGPARGVQGPSRRVGSPSRQRPLESEVPPSPHRGKQDNRSPSPNGLSHEFTAIGTKRCAGLKDTAAFAGKTGRGVVQARCRTIWPGKKIAGADVVRFPDANAVSRKCGREPLDGWVGERHRARQYLDQEPGCPAGVRLHRGDQGHAVRVRGAQGQQELLTQAQSGLRKAIADACAQKMHARFFK